MGQGILCTTENKLTTNIQHQEVSQLLESKVSNTVSWSLEEDLDDWHDTAHPEWHRPSWHSEGVVCDLCALGIQAAVLLVQGLTQCRVPRHHHHLALQVSLDRSPPWMVMGDFSRQV